MLKILAASNPRLGKELVKRAIELDLEVEVPSKNYIEELINNEYVFENVVENLEKGSTVVIYDSVSDLGEDNQDNGCRESDDTDESFGEFLLEAYKQGQTNDVVYFEFTDGKILSV